MSIQTAITAAQQRVADCYTAISNKGGTLPQTQNLANMPTAINSISGGGSGYSELPSYQISNGTASMRSATLTGNEFSSISTINDYAFYYKFYNNTTISGAVNFNNLSSVGQFGLGYAFMGCTGITSVDLSSLSRISASSCCIEAFMNCSNITSIDLSSLTTVSSSNACFQMFYGCDKITSLDLSSLTTVSGQNACQNMFARTTYPAGVSSLASVDLSNFTTASGSACCTYMFSNTSLVSISFPKLETLTGNAAFQYMFRYCTNIESISFPALKTTSFGSSNKNQFQYFLSNTGTDKTHTIHFPSNLESTIQGLTGYPLFGGTSGYVVLSFDLPQTE